MRKDATLARLYPQQELAYVHAQTPSPTATTFVHLTTHYLGGYCMYVSLPI